MSRRADRDYGSTDKSSGAGQSLLHGGQPRKMVATAQTSASEQSDLHDTGTVRAALARKWHSISSLWGGKNSKTKQPTHGDADHQAEGYQQIR
jgi:hypothetical protein